MHVLHAAALFGLCLSTAASANAQNKYMGSATCASSNCHGSVSPKQATNVRQNEYSIWYRNGAHAQAYEVLKNKDSKIIAGHLGIKDASSAPLCLKCHSTYVPESMRSSRFRLSDGVGCESCHGAAEKYLKPHTARNSTHSENVRLGLIDLVSLKVRAKVCLECHYGTDDQTVNHRLIGAGHPRLTYELDTYGILQPNHWEVDNDYVKRKAAYNSARAWIVGQIVRASEMLSGVLSNKRSKHGAMPELVNFYCYSCHHSLKEDQWKSRSYGGAPGELHLNISSLLLVREGLKVIKPELAKSLDGELSGLHAAYTNGSAQAALQKIKTMLDGPILSAANGTSFRGSVSENLIKQIAKYSAANSALPYEVAEQCAMAISAIAAGVDPKGARYQAKIDKLYDALKDEESFKSAQFSSAAKAF